MAIMTTKTFLLFPLAILASVSAGGLLLACSDDDDDLHAAGVVDASPDTTPATQDAGARSDAQEDTGAPAPATSTVTSFEAKGFELAEGLVLRDGKAYVSLAPLGTIYEIAPNGTKTKYASVTPGYTAGYTLGFTFDAAGDLFVAETKNDPDAGAQLPGIYKIPKGSTDVVATPFASDPGMTFPNGIVTSPGGSFLVTDSAAGKIFQVTPAGVVTTWKSDPKLAGTTACNAPLPFPIGANGIVYTPAEVFVTNTANGALLGIAVNPDGSAGALRVIVEDCANAGFDGLARSAKDGSFVVAQNGAPGRLVRVSQTGAVTPIPTSGLDGPASVVLGAWNGASSAALVTSSAFFSVGVDGGAPHPSLSVVAPVE